ncbi:MAG: type II secretion system protein [Candidatus Riflebacteria bacterium]|nr:type II secretion system protein [Candidatus Riflebacteria bacterium]
MNGTSLKDTHRSVETTARRGLSLVELAVVSVLLAILASAAFPVYKIFQQRSKEHRLKNTLFAVRSAIYGSKSQSGYNFFTQGYRSMVRNRIMARIETELPEEQRVAAQAHLIQELTSNDFKGYPETPQVLWNRINHLVSVDFPAAAKTLTADFEYRFLRKEPVHPFADWYPGAHFCFISANDPDSVNRTPIKLQDWNPAVHKGVVDIVSVGAGLALDGSSTDNW